MKGRSCFNMNAVCIDDIEDSTELRSRLVVFKPSAHTSGSQHCMDGFQSAFCSI